jgi:hypothetical protein
MAMMIKYKKYDKMDNKTIQIPNNKMKILKTKPKSKIGESEFTEELETYVTLLYLFFVILILDVLKYIFN